MSEYRYIGKPTRRIDGTGIVTGRTKYSDDLIIPNALYLRVLRSPHAHAEIVSIDTSKAEALPGVRSVMTYKNAPAWKTGMPAHRPVMDHHIRCVGDTVATVAAVTDAIAQKALKLIEVEYEVLTPVFDVEEAIKDGAPEIYRAEDHIESKGYVYDHNQLPPGSYFEGEDPPFYYIREGNADEELAKSDVICEGKVSYDNPGFPGAPETPFVAAQWEDEGHVTVWCSAQGPNMLAKPLGLTIGARVRAISSNVGGSYGNKDSLAYPAMLTVAAAKVAKAPVRYSMTKEEHLLCYERRFTNKFIGKIGLMKDGTITGIKGDWLVNTGIGSELSQGQVAEGLGEVYLPLNEAKSWDLTAKVICTNRQPVGIARGFGGQELKACLFHILNKGLKEIDMDPVAFFRKNFCKPGHEYYWRNGHKYSNPQIDYRPVMDEAAEKFGWKDKWKGWCVPTRVEGNKAYGVGFSLHSSGDPASDETFAYVRIENDQVTVHTAVPEEGNGQKSSIAKVVAEILNVPMEVVTLTASDNHNAPQDFGLAGSRGTITGQGSAAAAAFAAKKKLLEEAAEKMGCTPEELDTKDMMVFKKADPSVALPWIAICPIYYSITGTGAVEGDFGHINCVMTFVEVSADLETGLVKVEKILSASDVGQVISPIELKMQFEGGFGSAGIDTAQLEGHILDPVTGRTMTANMIDYKWRPFNELPPVDIYLKESKWDSPHPFGAIGIGEITGAPGIPAVYMAIENAIGRQCLDQYPATPDVILKALGKN